MREQLALAGVRSLVGSEEQVHLDLLEGVDLLIKLMLDLEHRPEGPLAEQSDLIERLLLTACFDEGPDLLRLLNDLVLWSFSLLLLLSLEFHDLYG